MPKPTSLTPDFAHQVSPSELESIILEIPEVAEVSVIGVPNDRLGEAPRAYVIAASKIAEEKVGPILLDAQTLSETWNDSSYT